MIVLLFTIFTLSSALDMSIISYDRAHGQGSSWRMDEEVMALYEHWLVKHGKLHNDLGEKEKRFEIFKDNLRFIDERNAENRTYKLGLNRFADLTNEEYRANYLGARVDHKRRIAKTRSNRYAPRVGEELPDSVDWRKEGAVVEVKDQGQCGQYCVSPFSFLFSFNKEIISTFNFSLFNCNSNFISF